MERRLQVVGGPGDTQKVDPPPAPTPPTSGWKMVAIVEAMILIVAGLFLVAMWKSTERQIREIRQEEREKVWEAEREADRKVAAAIEEARQKVSEADLSAARREQAAREAADRRVEEAKRAADERVRQAEERAAKAERKARHSAREARAWEQVAQRAEERAEAAVFATSTTGIDQAAFEALVEQRVSEALKKERERQKIAAAEKEKKGKKAAKKGKKSKSSSDQSDSDLLAQLEGKVADMSNKAADVDAMLASLGFTVEATSTPTPTPNSAPSDPIRDLRRQYEAYDKVTEAMWTTIAAQFAADHPNGGLTPRGQVELLNEARQRAGSRAVSSVPSTGGAIE